MKHKLIKNASVILGICISVSLLSGADVMFQNWFAAPKEISRQVIMLLSVTGMVKVIDAILSFLFLQE